MTPALAILLSSVVLLIVVLLPDLDDPTQRSFRGLMFLFGMVVCLIPCAAIFLGLTLALHVSPLVAAVPADLIAFGIAIGLSTISGGLYASYNPSE